MPRVSFERARIGTRHSFSPALFRSAAGKVQSVGRSDLGQCMLCTTTEECRGEELMRGYVPVRAGIDPIRRDSFLS